MTSTREQREGETMRTNVHPTAELGELVVAAFDKAGSRRRLTCEDCRIPTEVQRDYPPAP